MGPGEELERPSPRMHEVTARVQPTGGRGSARRLLVRLLLASGASSDVILQVHDAVYAPVERATSQVRDAI